MQVRQRQQGISLLEILLVLVVAAIIVCAAVAYFSQTLSNTHVSQAVDLIRQINKAGGEWRQIPGANAQYPQDYTSLVSGGANGLDTLVNAQLISCPNHSCYDTPWGANTVMLTVDSAHAQYMLLTFSRVPSSDCARLKEQMKNMAVATDNSVSQNVCIAGSSQDTVNYQVYL